MTHSFPTRRAAELATAQSNERRASVCFLGQSCGKRQRRTLSINNGVGVQSLRSGKNVKPTPIGTGRDHMANQGRRLLRVNSEGLGPAAHAHTRTAKIKIRIDADGKTRSLSKLFRPGKCTIRLPFRFQIYREERTRVV